MRERCCKLIIIVLAIALFVTAHAPSYRNHIYAKQTAVPPMKTSFRIPALRSNNAGSFNVEGGVAGVDWTYTGNVLSIIKSGPYKITGNGQQTSEKVVVKDSFQGTIEINNVNIYSSPDTTTAPFDIGNATVTLIISGENKLYEDYGSGYTALEAGLAVGPSGHLTIEGDGTLHATGSHGAGIGGDYKKSSGSITINSGTIYANSTADSAGIGAGYYAPVIGDIVINGGNIWASGSPDGGAAIGGSGGGMVSPLSNITINGGTITANVDDIQGDHSSAAIGGGQNSAARVTINGGIVTATIDGDGAAIGSGQRNLLEGGGVTINGGTIMARSKRGAAIGSGMGVRFDTGQVAPSQPVSVFINGGTISASSNHYIDTQDIGYGFGTVNPIPVVITGGSVKASLIDRPTDALGHALYLAKVPVHSGINSLVVDGHSFHRAGDHSPDDSDFYLYVTGQNHRIGDPHKWNTTLDWDAATKSFAVGPQVSDGVATNVSYDNSSSIPEPDNPTNPNWIVQVPSSITFTDTAKKFDANVMMKTVNGGAMPNYAVDVLVQSKNKYQLKLDTSKLEYDLQYQQNGAWVSMKKSGTGAVKLGTFQAGSDSGATIKGEAILSGVATKSGVYKDSLTYTIQKGS